MNRPPTVPRPERGPTAARPAVPRPRPASRPGSGPAPRPAPRTVDATETAPPRRPPRWLPGLLAGVQGALLSLLAVTLPALAAFVATSADPANAEVAWPQAAGVGATIWLMGHGLPASVDGAVVSLVPLGVTGLAVFTAWASAKRSARPDVTSWLAGVVGYLLLALLVAAVVAGSGGVTAGPVGLVRGLLGVLVVAAAGLGAGTVPRARLRELTRPAWSRVHPLLRSAGVAATVATAVLVGAAALATAGWVLSRRAPAGDVIAALGLDTFGGLLMALAQLAVAPNLVLWFLAWLVGPGFAVGSGTLYAPHDVVGGPVPALPMLAALPSEASGGALRWVPVVALLAGVLAGWWLHRRVPVRRWWEPFVLTAACAASSALLVAVLTALAAGSAGPGRLAVVGASPLLVGGVVGGLVLAGALVVVVPGAAAFRLHARVVAGRAWARLRGRPAPDAPA